MPCDRQPPAPVDRLGVERFQYTPLGEQLALVRLLTRLDERLAPPADARLVVRRGDDATSHPARACRLGDLAGGGRRRRQEPVRLWRASFALSLDIVEYPQAVFELAAPDGSALALPGPALLVDVLPDVAELRSGLIPTGQMLRRLAAVVTVCTVTSASTPAISWAASGLGGNTAKRAHRQEVQDAVKAHRAATQKLAAATSGGATVRVTKPVARVKDTHPQTAPHAPQGHTGPATPRHHAAQPERRNHSTQPKHAVQPKHATQPKHAVQPKHATQPEHTTQPKPDQHAAQPTSHGHAAQPEHPGLHHHPAQPGIHHHPAEGEHATPAHHGARGHHAERPGSLTPAPPQHLSPTPPDTSVLSGSEPGIATNPALAHELSRLSTLLADGDQPPSFLVPIYRAAGRRYHVPWKILAAINAIETDYGRNLNTSSSGAVGWMQFMPATWHTYGVSTSPKRRPDPYNPADAIYSAARYLAANGAGHDLRKAIFAYNHADWYVNEVMWKAQVIKGDGGLPVTGSARAKVAAMEAMADLLVGKPYIWGGGHSGWGIEPGYDCSGFVSAVLHAAGYLSEPQTTDTLPSQPGIERGPGRYVTIFDRAGAGQEGHVIVDLNGKFFESGGSAAAGGGAGVKRLVDPPADYLASFNLLLHPSGL